MSVVRCATSIRFTPWTHHRGQVTAMLSQTDALRPDPDMHRVLIPEPGRATG